MNMPEYRIEGMIGEGQARAEPLAEFLSEDAGPVHVIINSPGGDAFEGAALKAEIERHGRVTATGEGVVASAASLALMGGAEIVLHRDAFLMIHDPSGLTFGPAETHRKTATTLDKLTRTYAEGYARASGNKVDHVMTWMREETWLNAEEALALNFTDRIEGGERMVACAAFDFTRFKKPPAQLVQLARQYGWTAEPSDTGRRNNT